jgi:hypothetical protein
LLGFVSVCLFVCLFVVRLFVVDCFNFHNRVILCSFRVLLAIIALSTPSHASVLKAKSVSILSLLGKADSLELLQKGFVIGFKNICTQSSVR